MRIILFLLLMVAVSYAQAEEVAVVGVGQSQNLKLPKGSRKIHLSNSKVLRAEDLGNTLQITGKVPGNVVIETGVGVTWRVYVLPPDEMLAYSTTEKFLHGMRGLKSEFKNGHYEVTGTLLRASDWIKLSTISGASFQFAAQSDSDQQILMREKIQESLKAAHLPRLSLQFSPEAVAFITSDQIALKSSFERVLRPYGFRVEVNPSLVTIEPLVRVRILVTELRKTLSRQIGIKWSDSVTAQLLPNWAGPGQIDNVLVQLHALEDRGLGKILASPNLLCRSGKEAEFLAGGEFPIKIVSFKSQDVVWKKYGVILKIQPLADSSGHMSIALQTEVSMIDPSHVVDGIPGLLTNHIESHFDLSHSRTIALSGLIKKEWGDSRSGLPFLSQIPVLGLLFSSKDYQDNQTELVVFVTPEVITDETGDGV